MLKPVGQIEELVLVALHNHDRPAKKVLSASKLVRSKVLPGIGLICSNHDKVVKLHPYQTLHLPL